MAVLLNTVSSLLCVEDYRIVDDDEEEEDEEEIVTDKPNQQTQNLIFLAFDFSSEKSRISSLLDKEVDFLPRHDYLTRLHCGNLDVSARNDSVHWIYEVHRHYSFQPLTACLSVNYLDRFLSDYELPHGKAWMVKLLSVSCLSLAAKMEEIDVPSTLDLQVGSGDSKLIFEARAIQKMELLVLSVLKWRTNAVTPFSFIDFFLYRLTYPDCPNPKSVILRSLDLTLIAIKGIEFLEFRPSEIALAVAISVAEEIRTVQFSEAVDMCSPSHIIHKARVWKCYELIQEILSMEGGGCLGSYSARCSPPTSPNGVLDAAACLSSDSSEKNIGVSSSSSSSSSYFESGLKRRKLNEKDR